MEIGHYRVSPVSIPLDSEITKTYASVNLADAYSVELPAGASTDPELLARFVFSQLSPWMTVLMKIRDAVVAAFGVKTIKQLTLLGEEGKEGHSSRIGFFKVYNISEREIVLGEDDKHLDFRLSVLCSSQTSPIEKHCLTLSTVVHCHNRLGRFYIFVITPFHRVIVQSILRRAARSGWPSVVRHSYSD